MDFKEIRVQAFRNVEFAVLQFSGKSIFLHGRNGQGKSNLLEALGLITALRSFRTADSNAMIHHEKHVAQIHYSLVREDVGPNSVMEKLLLSLTGKGKEVELNGERARRLSEVVGLFPTVTMSISDIQLLRGMPALRRRFLDLMLSSTSRDYLLALTRYHKALVERNALLKQMAPISRLAPYEQVLATEGFVIFTQRASAIKKLSQMLTRHYCELSPDKEEPELTYRPNLEAENPEAILKLFEVNRERDFLLKSTSRGVHRDDIEFHLKGRKAREFGSDGQQRGLVVALRLAELEFFEQQCRVRPVLLADDILGELDGIRTANFWKQLDPNLQVIATGTEIPNEFGGRIWQVYEVEAGKFLNTNREPQTFLPQVAQRPEPR